MTCQLLGIWVLVLTANCADTMIDGRIKTSPTASGLTDRVKQFSHHESYEKTNLILPLVVGTIDTYSSNGTQCSHDHEEGCEEVEEGGESSHDVERLKDRFAVNRKKVSKLLL